MDFRLSTSSSDQNKRKSCKRNEIEDKELKLQREMDEKEIQLKREFREKTEKNNILMFK